MSKRGVRMNVNARGVRIGWVCSFCRVTFYGSTDPRFSIKDHNLCDDCAGIVPVGALFLETRQECLAWLRDRERKEFAYAERLAAIDPKPTAERPVLEHAIDLGMLYRALADFLEARA